MPRTQSTSRIADTRPRFFWWDLALFGLGVSSAILTAIVVTIVALNLGFAIHMYFVWLVPAGALLCGMASAAGYPLGAMAIGRRLGKVAVIGVLIGGPLTYFLIFVFEYLLMEVNGRPVSAEVPFGTFVDAAIRGTTFSFLRSGGSTTPSLGLAGYPFMLLSLVGFVAGSYGIFATPPLRRIACELCARYMREIASISGYVTASRLESQYAYAHNLLARGESDAALKLIGALSQTDLDHRIELDVWCCDACTRDYHHLRVSLWDTMSKPPWVPIKQLDVSAQVPRARASIAHLQIDRR